MNNSYENIEELLLHKSYYQLTPNERAIVTREIGSEIEYENMREAMLAISHIHNNEPKIQPKKETKVDLLAMFDKEPNRKFVWLNSTWIWLFPQDKPFYAKPAFQLATVALLLLGSLTMFNNSFKVEENNLAQHKTKKPEDKKEQVRKTKENNELRKELKDSTQIRDFKLTDFKQEVVQKVKILENKKEEIFQLQNESIDSEVENSGMWDANSDKDFGADFYDDDEVATDIPIEEVAPPEGFTNGTINDLELVMDSSTSSFENTTLSNSTATGGNTYSYNWNVTPSSIDESFEMEEIVAKSEESKVKLSRNKSDKKDADLDYKEKGLMSEVNEKEDKISDSKNSSTYSVTLSAENQLELIELLNTSY